MKRSAISWLIACCLPRRKTELEGKGNTPPDVWFADKTPDYLSKHLIPADPSLWTLDRFEDFLAERKVLILAKMRGLKLIAPEAQADAPVTEMPAPTSAGAFTTMPQAE